MPGAGDSPTLTACVKRCLQYLVGSRNTPRLSRGTVQAIDAMGTLYVDKAAVRTTGDTTGLEAGSQVAMAWTRADATPGRRGVKPTAVLKHHARRPSPGGPSTAVTGIVEELFIEGRDITFRNQGQATPLGVTDSFSGEAIAGVAWSVDGLRFVAWTDTYRYLVFKLNREADEPMKQTATAAFESVVDLKFSNLPLIDARPVLHTTGTAGYHLCTFTGWTAVDDGFQPQYTVAEDIVDMESTTNRSTILTIGDLFKRPNAHYEDAQFRTFDGYVTDATVNKDGHLILAIGWATSFLLPGGSISKWHRLGVIDTDGSITGLTLPAPFVGGGNDVQMTVLNMTNGQTLWRSYALPWNPTFESTTLGFQGGAIEIISIVDDTVIVAVNPAAFGVEGVHIIDRNGQEFFGTVSSVDSVTYAPNYGIVCTFSMEFVNATGKPTFYLAVSGPVIETLTETFEVEISPGNFMRYTGGRDQVNVDAGSLDETIAGYPFRRLFQGSGDTLENAQGDDITNSTPDAVGATINATDVIGPGSSTSVSEPSRLGFIGEAQAALGQPRDWPLEVSVSTLPAGSNPPTRYPVVLVGKAPYSGSTTQHDWHMWDDDCPKLTITNYLYNIVWIANTTIIHLDENPVLTRLAVSVIAIQAGGHFVGGFGLFVINAHGDMVQIISNFDEHATFVHSATPKHVIWGKVVVDPGDFEKRTTTFYITQIGPDGIGGMQTPLPLTGDARVELVSSLIEPDATALVGVRRLQAMQPDSLYTFEDKHFVDAWPQPGGAPRPFVLSRSGALLEETVAPGRSGLFDVATISDLNVSFIAGTPVNGAFYFFMPFSYRIEADTKDGATYASDLLHVNATPGFLPRFDWKNPPGVTRVKISGPLGVTVLDGPVSGWTDNGSTPTATDARLHAPARRQVEIL